MNPDEVNTLTERMRAAAQQAQGRGLTHTQRKEYNSKLQFLTRKLTGAALDYGVGSSQYLKALDTRTAFQRNFALQQQTSAINALRQKQQQEFSALQTGLTETAAATQADIAKQLGIVQSEKDAVTKMTEQYTAMLKAEAEAKQKAEDDRLAALKVSQANQARANVSGQMQIKPASPTPTTAGTQVFRRRSTKPLAVKQVTSGINI